MFTIEHKTKKWAAKQYGNHDNILLRMNVNNTKMLTVIFSRYRYDLEGGFFSPCFPGFHF